MSDRRTGLPIDADGEPDKQGQGVQGMRGERSQDPGVEHPDRRRTIETPEGPITVEESSGLAYAEAIGASNAGARNPDANTDPPGDTLPIDAGR